MLIVNRLLILTCLLFGLSVRSACQQNLITSGGDVIGSGGTISFSVGQIDYIHFNSDGGNINLGLQQPYRIKVATDGPDLFPGISAFPNPVQKTLNIEMDDAMMHSHDALSYQLFDVNGKLISTQPISQPLTQLSLDHIESGLYLLSIASKQSRIKTFKIFKSN